MQNKILIVDDIHEMFFEKLKQQNIAFDYRPEYTEQDVFNCIEPYVGLVIRSKFNIQADFFERATELKFIARAGAGVDNINEQAAQDAGVVLINAPEGNRDAVGEHMIGMLFNVLNNLNRGDREIRSGIWQREENRGYELMGKTVGLIGYGNNGSAMAKKLSGFGVKVLAYDKYKKKYSDTYAEASTMEELFREVDVLSIHVPLTAETSGLINEGFIKKFHKPFFLLMGARGGIMDMAAICRALDDKKILGAAFDVLPIERFPGLAEASWFQNLKERENVIFSPHVAGWTFESYVKIAEVLTEKIICFFQKRK